MPDSFAPTAEYSLHQTWQDWKAKSLFDPNACQQLAKRANSVGEHLLAIEIAECTLENIGDADPIPLLQQKALALARSAATNQALQTLEQIRGRGGENEETFGMLGRVYKDLAAATSDADEKQRFYARSLELYRAGFEHSQRTNAFCGINAAAVAVLTGYQELARELAAQADAAPLQGDSYFDPATKAEAKLILKRTGEAADLYREACAAGHNRWADMVSTRNQCRLLSSILYEGRTTEFDKCFPLGSIAVFAGHMIDRPDRAEPRFPAVAEASVRERIIAWLKKTEIRLSYSSAAGGSDLIFLAAAQGLGVETHVVLPFAAGRFLETSVRSGGERWVEIFHQAMSRAKSITILNDDVADDASSAYDFTNRMIAAKAKLRAKAMGEESVKALCVWNGLSGDGGGGTADAVAFWLQAKFEVLAIRPIRPEEDRLVRGNATWTVVPFERTQSALPKGSRGTVCAMLHLYFEGYFALHENQYLLFQQVALATLAETLAVSPNTPVSRYGLGADYVFVFNGQKAAGRFAIEILEAMAKALQAANGLTMEMPRLCLHAGPVQLMVNPVLNQYTHEGAGLTRAGRIVRNVNPGVAYCTEPFAALAALEDNEDLRCEPAGTAKYSGGAQDRLFSVRYKQKAAS